MTHTRLDFLVYENERLNEGLVELHLKATSRRKQDKIYELIRLTHRIDAGLLALYPKPRKKIR